MGEEGQNKFPLFENYTSSGRDSRVASSSQTRSSPFRWYPDGRPISNQQFSSLSHFTAVEVSFFFFISVLFGPFQAPRSFFFSRVSGNDNLKIHPNDPLTLRYPRRGSER